MVNPKQGDVYLTATRKSFVLGYDAVTNKLQYGDYGTLDDPSEAHLTGMTHIDTSEGTVWFPKGHKVKFKVSFVDRNRKEHALETVAASVAGAVNNYLYRQGSKLIANSLASLTIKKGKAYVEGLTGRTFNASLLKVISLNFI